MLPLMIRTLLCGLLVPLLYACQNRYLADYAYPSFYGPRIDQQRIYVPDRHVTQFPKQEPPVPGNTGDAPVKPERGWYVKQTQRKWKYIVLHHSSTRNGSAAVFDHGHRRKGWDELGYHFVIGNGTNSGDGAVEIGSRWPKQKHGAHAKTADNRFNDYGIGICLVGNFDQTVPSPRQMRSTEKLVAYLMWRYDIPASRVIGHEHVKATNCPGKNFPLDDVRRRAQALVERSR